MLPVESKETLNQIKKNEQTNKTTTTTTIKQKTKHKNKRKREERNV